MNIQQAIHVFFEEQAKNIPHHIAAQYDNQFLSYDELNKKANQLAHYLLAIGVPADTPIALCIERSIDCLIIILAILKAGAGYLPIDPSHPQERLLSILNNSQTPLLITQSPFKKRFKPYNGTTIFMDKSQQKIEKQPLHNPNQNIRIEQLAYVIYTSGSTGSPKGVLIEHKSVINYCFWLADYCGLQQLQKIDFSANHAFDFAVTVSLIPLMLGLTVVLCSDEIKKNMKHYLEYLNTQQINFIKLTPSFFKLLVQEVSINYIELPYLNTIILGGENLCTIDCQSWLKLYPQQLIINEYGPTETTVGISSYTVCSANKNNLGTNVPIGKAGANIYCRVLDENLNLVPHEEIGELYIGGSCLARGYLNQPQLTEKQFIKDPFNPDPAARLYKTGDLCKQQPDGVLEYCGRMDSQIKIRGFRIEPGEIEKHLLAHPAIKTVAVLSQQDLHQEDYLIAYYILKKEHKPQNTTGLRKYLKQLLPSYMIPSAFIAIDSLPLTTNGKLDKSLLPIPTLTASQPYKKPKTPLEKTLSDIWSAELGIKNIGLKDDFFELGGHSLSAARIISKINHVLSKEITVQDFYNASTINQLIPLINKTKKIKKKRASYKKLSLNLTEIPLSDFQFLLWISHIFEPKAKQLNITAKKRLQGSLNKPALEFAFNAVLKKQEVLTYRILKFQPAQRLQKGLSFKIEERNLEHLSEQETNSTLKYSLTELSNSYHWPKDTPLLAARLFYLSQHRVELQISIPHIIADDLSPKILLHDLSRLYLLYQQNPTIEPLTPPYKEYIHYERSLQVHSNKHHIFWENYLHNAGLFTFSPAHVVNNRKAKNLTYSTYTKIAESELSNLRQFCAQNHISIKDGLSAAIALALLRCSNNEKQKAAYVYVNIIKSTRDSDIYDETIGCFLRIEPIKITLDKKATLISIAKQIHQATIDTSPYQQCADLIKLSSLGAFRSKRKKIRNYFIKVFTFIYAKLFSISALDQKTFQLCAERLSSFQRNNDFLININVHKNFIIESDKENATFFALNSSASENYQQDLLKINNVFEVCFLRNDHPNTPYLVLSANLEPTFREQIAQETLRILGSTPNAPSSRHPKEKLVTP